PRAVRSPRSPARRPPAGAGRGGARPAGGRGRLGRRDVDRRGCGVICTRCGDDEMEPGETCWTCGALAVAPDQLDSVLSMPAEPVPEELDGDPVEFSPLTVTAVTAGPMAEGREADDWSTTPDAPPEPGPGGVTPPPLPAQPPSASADPSDAPPLPR